MALLLSGLIFERGLFSSRLPEMPPYEITRAQPCDCRKKGNAITRRASPGEGTSFREVYHWPEDTRPDLIANPSSGIGTRCKAVFFFLFPF